MIFNKVVSNLFLILAKIFRENSLWHPCFIAFNVDLSVRALFHPFLSFCQPSFFTRRPLHTVESSGLEYLEKSIQRAGRFSFVCLQRSLQESERDSKLVAVAPGLRGLFVEIISRVRWEDCAFKFLFLFFLLSSLRSFPFSPNFWRESLERIFFILIHSFFFFFFILFGGISCNL